jgi:carboxylesterase type B
MDQRLALQWVHKHIRDFGGDPNRIMVAGQSAGAASVSVHLVARKSWGLAKRATMLSGAFPTWITQTWEDAVDAYANTLSVTGCPPGERGLTCLRALSASTVFELDSIVADNGWGPTVDGSELAARPWELAQRGEVDPGIDTVIAGATAEDGGAPVWCDGNKDDLVAWLLSDVFPDNQTLAREVADLYVIPLLFVYSD